MFVVPTESRKDAAISKRSTHSQRRPRLRFASPLSATPPFPQDLRRKSREDSDQGSEKRIRTRRWEQCRTGADSTTQKRYRYLAGCQNDSNGQQRDTSAPRRCPRARARRLCSVLCSVLFNVHVPKIYRGGACSDRRRTD